MPARPLRSRRAPSRRSRSTAPGRTIATIGAASALLLALTTPASADPGPDVSVNLERLTAPARAALAAVPVVQAPADATWTFDAPEAIAVAPEPEPVPEAPQPEAAPQVSRSQERAEPAEEPHAVADESAVVATAASSVLDVAAQYVGVPYVSGGTGPGGFDCSGFTQFVYAQIGVSLPRTSGEQRYAGTVVSRDQAQPGDLIWSPGHVAIYAGGNTQVDAPKPGGSVQFRSIWQPSPVFIRVG